MEKKKELLQTLPKIDESMSLLEREYPRQIPSRLLKKIVRSTVEQQRTMIINDPDNYKTLGKREWKELFFQGIEESQRFNLRRVINGTGVVIHTNLGRSLLSDQSATQMLQCSQSYTNLEFDLKSGKRGSRYSLVEELICDLTGAEAALVVNNNAAAVLLVIETLAQGKQAVVSRGELVEIGGSFRIPDVMAKSGAILVEVGATNRTHLYDYQRAISEETALLLKVHTSNFRMLGFTKEVATEELASLAAENHIALMEDLGSGCLLDMSRFGLPKERTVQEVVKAGADIVTFSGDKLLGGPQAGIIVGKQGVIDKIKKNPLNRALRIDKFTLASLESVLRCYYDTEDVLQIIPTLRMLTEDSAHIKKRAQKALRKIKKSVSVQAIFSLESTISQTGGGALPEYGLTSWALAIHPSAISLNRLERDMRNGPIPLLGRIENDRYIIDFRTILDSDINDLAAMVIEYFSN